MFGDCPVRSDRTLCCNLKTIDAVQNCSFGCSYCTIQTFYGDRVTVDRDLGRKLREIDLDDRRFYHIGTGQSSDSLVWGNRAGMLDELCRFAAEHPNVLLELKTKSSNVSYFLDRQVPANLVCSWSLNTAAVIEHEEHFTASLERRLAAARRFADGGRRVAFHFHPMVHHDGWDTEYPALAERLLDEFAPQEVAFVSMGSVTFIKPVIEADPPARGADAHPAGRAGRRPARQAHLSGRSQGAHVPHDVPGARAVARARVPVPVHGEGGDLGPGVRLALRVQRRV